MKDGFARLLLTAGLLESAAAFFFPADPSSTHQVSWGLMGLAFVVAGIGIEIAHAIREKK